MNGYLATVKIGLKGMWVAIGAGQSVSDGKRWARRWPAYCSGEEQEAIRYMRRAVMRVSTKRVHLGLRQDEDCGMHCE
jgi:hypothetical protein